MYKLKLFLLPVALLLAFMAFACAPPDDDDRSSGPTINNAIYDVGTAILTVQGTDLSPTTATQAQIQTIRVGSRTNGVAFSSYTADDDATGVNSNGLEPGKYRMKSDGTALWLRLTNQHKAVLEAKTGMNNDSLKKGLLSVGTGAWAGLNTAKDLTVNILGKPSKQTEAEQDEQAEEESRKQTEDEQAEEVEQAEEAEEQSRKQTEDEQVEQAEQVEEQSRKQTEDEQAEQAEEESPKQPKAEEQSPKAAITRATYHVGTALLTVQGTDLGSATQAQIQTIKVYGVVLNSYTADGTATGTDSNGLAKGKYRIKSDGTALWLYLTDADKTTLEAKPGMNKDGRKVGKLTSTGIWAGLNTAKALAVSGNPAITSATYDAVTDLLVITGTNLPSTVDGWDFSKLRFVSGTGLKSIPLKKHSTTGEDRATGSSASGTFLAIILKGDEKNKVRATLILNGLGDDGGAYNLEAAAGFVIGSSAEDTSNNPITVSGYKSSISTVYYYRNKGELVIYGSKLPRAVAEWDFSKLTLVSGDGSKRYKLPRHSTLGNNKATGSSAIRSGLKITLSGSVKAEVEKILVKVGDSDNNGEYNLEAAAGFVTGNPEDLTNQIVVRASK